MDKLGVKISLLVALCAAATAYPHGGYIHNLKDIKEPAIVEYREPYNGYVGEYFGYNGFGNNYDPNTFGDKFYPHEFGDNFQQNENRKTVTGYGGSQGSGKKFINISGIGR